MNNINFPKHWKNVRLKELASLRRESIQPENDLCLNYVGLEHIDSGESQLKRWGNASEVKSTKNRFYADDILYGKLRAYLDKVVIAEMEGICSTDILVVTANSKTIPRFLVYLLHTHPLISHAVTTSTGVNHPRTSWNSLGEFILALPPLSEQRAIAHVLQTIQEAKATRQREIELEQERKAALMDNLFSHGTKGEPRKQTEIGEIPESWEVTKLGDLVKLKSGLSRPKDIKSQPNSELTVPVYGGNGILGYTSKKFSAERLLVIGRVGAYCGCVHIAEAPNWITDNALYPEKWFSSEIYLDFLAEQLRHFNLNRLQRRGGQPLITQSILHQLKIPLPPFSEQRAIAGILLAVNEKTAALEQEVKHLDELFHAMLDELMTGQRSAVPLIENGEI